MDPTSADVARSSEITLRRLASYRGIRVLTWDRDVLYACRGYEVLRLLVGEEAHDWHQVAHFRPPWWRNLTSRHRLTYRLVRDGFHALTVLDDGTMIGAVPGAIVTRAADDDEFRVTHRIKRGTRPLHITRTLTGTIYWGEYFDNRERKEVHIYGSEDGGASWQIAYTFPERTIRHIHNVVNDPWGNWVWILTGDEGSECKILRASAGLSSIETVLEGHQQTRSVAAVPTPEALYLSTDTPFEPNHVYRLDRPGNLERVGDLNSSSIYGCKVGTAMFFSTMAEPSAVNDQSEVQIAASTNGCDWNPLLRWKKDFWPMRYFQYGNVIFPDGNNTSNVLAATTIAVAADDLTTSLWAVS